MVRVVLVSSLIAVASLGCAPDPARAQGVAIAIGASGAWEGTWLTADSSLEDNVYTMLSIEEAGIRSFTYELENRVVPYGPNAEWFDGRAVFVNPTEAVDSEAGRTFRLRVDPEDRDERVIELDGELFLFQRGSVEAGERITQVTPIEEALAEAADDVKTMEGSGQLNLELEREVLEAFYHAAGGPDARFESAWLSDLPLSAWDGVTTNAQGRVQVLGKANAGASGPIPPELGQLTSLEVLILSFNEFSGPIPPELGQLTNLEELSLENNQLSGPIPVVLGDLTGLTELSIDGDTGLCLPAEIQDTVFGRLAIGNYVPLCTALSSDREVLEALHSTVTGFFRPNNWLSDAPISTWSGVTANEQGRVERLDMAPHRLAGPIPPELGQLSRLISLYLFFNESSGPIPPELGQLTNLVRLGLIGMERGGLSGPIPPEFGRLIHLQELSLNNNQLSGPIPVELGDLTGLTELSIDGDTGLCLPAEIQDTVLGRLAIDSVPLCGTRSDEINGGV